MADDIEPPGQSSGQITEPATAPPPVEDKAPRAPKSPKGKAAEPVTTQAEPTAPRPRDPKTGLELDEYGLPTSGPARRQWLAEAGIDDPALMSTAEKENSDG